MTRKFSELRAKMSPAARAESARVAAELRRELPLHLHQQTLKVSPGQASEIPGSGGQRYGTDRPITLAEALAQPDVSNLEFDPPKINGPLSKPVDLSS